MTTATVLDTEVPNKRRDAIMSLARAEARRALRGPAFLLGLVVTIWFGFNTSTAELDWQSGAYQGFSTVFGPLAAGIFVAGVLAAGRDRRNDDRPALAEEAALDGADRTTARLLALLPLVLIGAVIVVAAAVGTRIEGGFWIGNRPGRTDTAVHGLAEVIQPILVFVFAAAAGVAAGRTFRRRAPVVIVGLVFWFMVTGAYWVWQSVPTVYATPIQTQPIEVAIDGDATDPTTFPADWLLANPDEAGGEWTRTLVHQPLAAWHDVYLIGLATLAAGVAIRSRKGQRLAVAGLIVAGLGIAAQAVVMPDNVTTVEVPQ